ncbi:MAG: hypothetical protein JSR59_01135 [Proteobacteria bacterium]|nr:hypothetical protein [Pseudomonadota bacterium]
MSGSNSSAHASAAARDAAAPLVLAVHSMPTPAELGDAADRRTSRGRWMMLLVLLTCAAPVVASYFTYYVLRPSGRTNYSELIQPMRPIPADLPLADLQGRPVPAGTLKGQWLLVVVAGGACDPACEKQLWLQRQLRETLGAEKDRVDKVWLIDDAAVPRAETLAAISAGMPTTVLRVPRAALAGWLTPGRDGAIEGHMAIVDPMGNWMMRVPANPEPGKLKRDVDRLLRASASWDTPGR